MDDEYVKVAREVSPACSLPEDPNTPVWRYLTLKKFRSLLGERALYLRRIDLLEDEFEGTYSRQKIDEADRWLREKGHPDIAADEERSRQRERRSAFVSCWCARTIDLDLMWRAYSSLDSGVAIKSTVRRLRQACDDADDLYPLDLSMVNYVEHVEGGPQDYPRTPGVFFEKDRHFELDNELRIVCWRKPPQQEGILLPVDLGQLIVEVVTSPKAPIRLVSIVEILLAKSGLTNVPINHSRQNR